MNFIEILNRYNISYKQNGEHHHCTEGWIQTDCPNCSPESGHYRLGFNLSFNYFSCWSCGGLPLVPTLAILTKESYKEINKLLTKIDKNKITTEVSTGILKLPGGIEPLLPAHKKYLENRGFDPDYLQTYWKIQGIGIASRLTWRIFIPVYYHGQIVTWTTRGITDKEPRYINAKKNEESISVKKLLFGEDYVRQSIIVVEGPFDVFRIGPGAVATMGISISRAQILKMIKYPRVTVCFDNEPQAQKRARKLCDQLEVLTNVVYNVTLDSKDAGSAKRKEIKELRKRFLE